MARELLNVGDRLTRVGGWKVGNPVLGISIDQLPGPMGFYLVAVVRFEDDRADLLIPLHMADSFEALNP